MALADEATRRKYVSAHLSAFLPAGFKQTQLFNWSAFAVNRSIGYYAVTSYDSDTAENKAAVASGANQAQAFLDVELGTAPPHTPAFDARTPPMLDLADACRTEVAQSPADVDAKATSALQWRVRRIIKITLRALAINTDFWGIDNLLKADALREYLDRRMRVVEMMNFHVNPVTNVSPQWNISVTPAGDPVWLDGYRNRLFEYPQINSGDEGRLEDLIDRAPPAAIRSKEGNTSKLYQPQPQNAADQWDWLLASTPQGRPVHMVWDHKPPYPETLPTLSAADAADRTPAGLQECNLRLPTVQERRQWRLSRKDLYTLMFYKDTSTDMTFVQAIDRMFRLRDSAGVDTRLNFYDRNWLNCDHVIAALQCEALLLAWRRRVEPAQVAHAEAALNLLAETPTPPGAPETRYAWLGAMIRDSMGSSEGLLDGRSPNQFFRTRQAPLQKIEIGDHVIFWNNNIYDVLESGLLRLENALIIDIDEQNDGLVARKSFVLAGHGMQGTPDQYLQTFVVELKGLVNLALARIQQQVGNTGRTRVPLPLCEAVKWTPYPELTAGPANSPEGIGAWWLVYPLDKEKTKGRNPVAAEAVLELPGAVGIGKDTAMHDCILMSSRKEPLDPMKLLPIPFASDFTPFNAVFPDLTPDKFILLPLTQPKMARTSTEKSTPSWARYFQRRTAPTAKPRALESVAYDSTLIPGLAGPTGLIWTNGPTIRLTLP